MFPIPFPKPQTFSHLASFCPCSPDELFFVFFSFYFSSQFDVSSTRAAFYKSPLIFTSCIHSCLFYSWLNASGIWRLVFLISRILGPSFGATGIFLAGRDIKMSRQLYCVGFNNANRILKCAHLIYKYMDLSLRSLRGKYLNNYVYFLVKIILCLFKVRIL